MIRAFGAQFTKDFVCHVRYNRKNIGKLAPVMCTFRAYLYNEALQNFFDCSAVSVGKKKIYIYQSISTSRETARERYHYARTSIERDVISRVFGREEARVA